MPNIPYTQNGTIIDYACYARKIKSKYTNTYIYIIFLLIIIEIDKFGLGMTVPWNSIL